ncbi:GntR family transcriptional regulator [Mycobacterium intracellulare]|uniref:GntR family transcriptional regulator n=1 Tax=Mycobacterium intracellulare TaxID=1767 RepID=UPI001CDB086D|nr:GntR family transcriptional regulator [Mycobacterium intracellulare]MCA2256000.1 GntR family transcriptional regulator [Mycobacterium intracellulare]
MTLDKDAADSPARTSGLRSIATPNSTVDRVTDEIRRAVLNGTLAAGSTFSIADLSTKLGVSHIPVRESLRRLEAQGLVTLRPGRSAMISPIDREELRSIYRLRQDIEPGIAGRACPMLTPDDIQEAERLLKSYIEGDHDADTLWKVHRQFHLALMRPALTPWDLRILDQLWHASDRYTRVVFAQYHLDAADLEHREVAHRMVLDSARSQSALEAKQALSAHLAENELACLEWIATLAATS